MKRKIFRKISLLFSITFISLMLTSCNGSSDTVMTFTNNTLADDISKRFSANIDIINQLKESGFVSPEVADGYIQTIARMQSDFLTTKITISEGGKINGNADVLKAISQLATYEWATLGKDTYTDHVSVETDGESKEYTVEYDSGMGDKYLGNFVISNAFAYGPSKFAEAEVKETRKMIIKHIHPKIKHLDGVKDNFGGEDDSNGDAVVETKVFKYTDIVPLEIVNDDIVEDITKKLNYEIYVLKSDIFTQDGNSTIDSVVLATREAFKKSADKEKSQQDISKDIYNALYDYFQPLKDDSGKAVTLLDLAGEDFSDFSIVQNSYDVDINNYDKNQKPGYDLVVTQNEVNKPVMSIKFHEFNYDAFMRMKETLGLNAGKFYFVADGSNSGKAYILEYPVYTLYNLMDDGNKVYGMFKPSGLGINFYTNKIIKYDVAYSNNDTYNFSDSGTVVSDATDKYLTIVGADVSGDQGKSSFIVKGTAPMTYTINVAGKNKTIQADVGRIILRDYLEGTYAPGFHTSEDVVVFGRKIRLMFHSWTDNSHSTIWNKQTAAAKFIDKDGNDITDGQKLYVTDFCDSMSLLDGNNARIEVLPGINEVYESIRSTAPQTGDFKSIDNLDIHKVSSINPTLMFPSNQIGKSDFASDIADKQRFWVLTTRKGIFNSGLYNGWINSTSSTASLTWWNSYLHFNSFEYTVGQVELNNYILGNYKYEASKYGDVLIVDLDTIKFIQDEMKEDAEIDRNQSIRTAFIIFGWFLICYSVLLMLAWVVDTNADIGIDLLNKLTMGNWIAVKYRDDIPVHDASSVKYIDSSKLMLSIILLIALGIILISVNLFDLIVVIIEHTGSISRTLEKLLQGTR